VDENGEATPCVNEEAGSDHFGELSSKVRMEVLGWLFLNLWEAKPKEAAAFMTSMEITGLLRRSAGISLAVGQVQEALLLLGYEPWDSEGGNWVYRVSRDCPCLSLCFDGISGLEIKNRCCHVAASRVDIV